VRPELRDSWRWRINYSGKFLLRVQFRTASWVKDRFLVDFSLYQAHTSFQRNGIKGVDLSEEDRNALTEQGIDPDMRWRELPGQPDRP
jgi:type I site-specific restriction endonuclease